MTKQSSRQASALPPGVAQIGSLARGLAILRVLSSSSRPLGLGEIAVAAELDQSTTHRLLRTLEESHYVLRHPKTRQYMASPVSFDPLPLLHPVVALRRECHGLLERAADELPFTIVFVLFQANERVIIDIARRHNTLVPYYSTWVAEPLHTNASGKLLLLTRSPAELAALLATLPLDAFAPRSLRTIEAIEADLARVARQGYATSLEEITQGLGAVAAPIRLGSETVGCVVATGVIHAIEATGVGAIAERLISLARVLPLQSIHLRGASEFLGAQISG